MDSLDKARKVKDNLQYQLEEVERDLNFAGIGFYQVGEVYGVKVNFHHTPLFNRPTEVIDGVPIIVVIVGDTTKRE